jgi:hypothetical protein
MKPIRSFALLAALLLPTAALVLTVGCKKEEETVAPAPAPTPTPTPTPAMALVPEEDAGVDASDAGDADADAAPKASGPDPVRACCNAIAGNMKSAPPDQQFAYASALATCNAAAASGQGRQALAAVRSALKSAGVPASCQ